MKRRIVLTLVLVFALALGTTLTALAQEPVTGEVIAIANEQTVSLSLKGQTGGSFWYATLAYPGNQAILNIKMNAIPADPVTVLGVGFNLYGADGRLLGSGALVDQGQLLLNYSNAKPEVLLLQIFNYIDKQVVSFSITAAGLPEPVNVAAVVPEQEGLSEAAPGESEHPEPIDEVNPIAGNLLGNSAGSFDRFAVFYASDGQVTVTMNYTPGDNTSNAIGLNIYDVNGQVPYIGGVTNINGVVTITFNASAGVRYQFVVQNYLPSRSITYNVVSNPVPRATSPGE